MHRLCVVYACTYSTYNLRSVVYEMMTARMLSSAFVGVKVLRNRVATGMRVKGDTLIQQKLISQSWWHVILYFNATIESAPATARVYNYSSCWTPSARRRVGRYFIFPMVSNLFLPFHNQRFQFSFRLMVPRARGKLIKFPHFYVSTHIPAGAGFYKRR